MSKYMTKSKATQMSLMQQAHKTPHPGSVATAMLTHEEIAKRAYEIYAEKECPQGQCEQNWLQAGRDMKNQDQAGDPAAY